MAKKKKTSTFKGFNFGQRLYDELVGAWLFDKEGNIEPVRRKSWYHNLVKDDRANLDYLITNKLLVG